MKIKCREVILSLDKHLCLLHYTFSSWFLFCRPINTPVLTFLSNFHFKSVDSSHVYYHMFLMEGREGVYLNVGGGEPTSGRMLMTQAMTTIKNAPLNMRIRDEREASEVLHEPVKISASILRPASMVEIAKSLKKAPVSLPHGSLRDTPLNSKERWHTSICVALHKGKEGTRDLQLLSLNSPISRSSGSLQIKNGNQEGAKIIPHD